MKLNDLKEQNLHPRDCLRLLEWMKDETLVINPKQEVLAKLGDGYIQITNTKEFVDCLKSGSLKALDKGFGKVDYSIKFGDQHFNGSVSGVIMVSDEDPKYSSMVLGKMSRDGVLKMYWALKRAVCETLDIPAEMLERLDMDMEVESVRLNCDNCFMSSVCKDKGKCVKK